MEIFKEVIIGTFSICAVILGWWLVFKEWN